MSGDIGFEYRFFPLDPCMVYILPGSWPWIMGTKHWMALVYSYLPHMWANWTMPLSGWLCLVPKISISIGGPNKKLGHQGGQTGNSWEEKGCKKQLRRQQHLICSAIAALSYIPIAAVGKLKARRFFSHLLTASFLTSEQSSAWGSLSSDHFSFAIRRSDHRSEVLVMLRQGGWTLLRSWTGSAPDLLLSESMVPILPWVSNTGASTVIQQSRKPPISRASIDRF